MFRLLARDAMRRTLRDVLIRLLLLRIKLDANNDKLSWPMLYDDAVMQYYYVYFFL